FGIGRILALISLLILISTIQSMCNSILSKIWKLEYIKFVRDYREHNVKTIQNSYPWYMLNKLLFSVGNDAYMKNNVENSNIDGNNPPILYGTYNRFPNSHNISKESNYYNRIFLEMILIKRLMYVINKNSDSN
ncbi:hypothetical protein HHI36_008133, partial [Cryptolaemus montrouzieri]